MKQTLIVSQQDALRVLEQYPMLNKSFGNWIKPRCLWTQRQFEQERSELFTNRSIETICVVADWLKKHIRPTKNLTPYSSYWWKHQLEKFVGYTRNGEFIAAAIVAGFRHKEECLNPTFNMSNRLINPERLSNNLFYREEAL